MLNDPALSRWSDKSARQIGIDHKTVAKRRKDYLGISQDNRVVARGDSSYEMNTAKIGCAPAVCAEVEAEMPALSRPWSSSSRCSLPQLCRDRDCSLLSRLLSKVIFPEILLRWNRVCPAKLYLGIALTSKSPARLIVRVKCHAGRIASQRGSAVQSVGYNRSLVASNFHN
jgi:hypothetical protein